MRRRRAAWTWLAGVAALGGCSNAPAPAAEKTNETFQTLVPLEVWSSVARADDPFITDPEAAPACVGPGFRLETDLQQLELDTGLCNWVTLRGSALFDVSAGQELQLEFSHYNLEAAAPATAELRLAFPDCDVWKKELPIPSAAAVYKEQIDSPCALKAGQAVLFHLHNHGQNSYQVQDLAVMREAR
jgi:hypothetical protein